MRFGDVIKTRFLLWLEYRVLALRQRSRLSRETSRRILKWIDEKLAARRSL
jgi:hypothetical protein